GDFLHVNGTLQVGLTRFTNTPGGAAPAVPKAPTLSATSAGRVYISYGDSYDLDNLTLTYNVFRGSLNVGSNQYTTYFWQPGQAPRRAFRAPEERAADAAGDQYDGRDQADAEAAGGGGQGAEDGEGAGVRGAQGLEQDDGDQHVVRLGPHARAEQFTADDRG